MSFLIIVQHFFKYHTNINISIVKAYAHAYAYITIHIRMHMLIYTNFEFLFSKLVLQPI